MFGKKKSFTLLVLIIAMLTISACAKATPTEDPAMKITELAATVKAEITLTAMAMPSATPTVTPTVTATPVLETPTPSTLVASPTLRAPLGDSTSGDNSAWDKDVTFPDYSIVAPGASFERTWSILNTGTTTWTKDYALIYLEGPQATTLTVNLTKDVKPGELAQISVKFVAPATNGAYTGWWRMLNANGYLFGEAMSIRFNVGNETPTPTTSQAATTATIISTTATPKTD